MYSHVYQWRGLVVSFCLLCNDPCWRSHNLSFHLSLSWLSLSLMLNMTRICRSQSLAHLHFGPSILATSVFCWLRRRTELLRSLWTSHLDEHRGAPKCSLRIQPRGLSLWAWGWQNPLHYDSGKPAAAKIGISPTSTSGYTGSTGQVSVAGVWNVFYDKATERKTWWSPVTTFQQQHTLLNINIYVVS